jgi:predicted DCC family thiol-disulfide oxidoreductase YuxK
MSRSVILFDGQCPFCRRSVALLKRLDWLGRFDYHDGRDGAGIPAHTAALDVERLTQEMHVLTPDRTRVLAGFRAVRWIAGRVPLLWPVWPLLFLPGMTRLGQKLYLWVARHRFHLVPCHDGVCTIPPKRT